MNDFKDNLIQKIKAEHISMRPRWHFVLKAFLLVAGAILAALIAVYLLSFVIFTLHRSGVLFAPQFGWHGVMMLVVSSPWLLLGMLGIFLLLLYVLVSKYSFSYQKPLVYSIVGVVLFVIVVSSLIQYYGFHERVQAFADRHNVPGLRPLYNDPADRRPAGVERGTIKAMTSSGFVLETDESEVLNIVINERTKLPPLNKLVIGDEVLVFGDRSQDSITAFGIKPARGGQFKLSPRHQGELSPWVD